MNVRFEQYLIFFERLFLGCQNLELTFDVIACLGNRFRDVELESLCFEALKQEIN